MIYSSTTGKELSDRILFRRMERTKAIARGFPKDPWGPPKEPQFNRSNGRAVESARDDDQALRRSMLRERAMITALSSVSKPSLFYPFLG